MEVKIEKMTLDELFDKMLQRFGDIFEEEYKPEVKYEYKETECRCPGNERRDYEEFCSRQQKEYEEMKDLYLKTRKELKESRKTIEILKEENSKIKEAADKVSENGHAIVERQSGINKLVNDKVSSDGYKIVNDIKVWVEFARKAGRLESAAFTDMLDMISKTVSSVPDGKKQVSC